MELENYKGIWEYHTTQFKKVNWERATNVWTLILILVYCWSLSVVQFLQNKEASKRSVIKKSPFPSSLWGHIIFYVIQNISVSVQSQAKKERDVINSKQFYLAWLVSRSSCQIIVLTWLHQNANRRHRIYFERCNKISIMKYQPSHILHLQLNVIRNLLLLYFTVVNLLNCILNAWMNKYGFPYWYGVLN